MSVGAAPLGAPAAGVESLSAEKSAAPAAAAASATNAPPAQPKLDLTTSVATKVIAETVLTAKSEADFISSVKDQLLPNLTAEQRASFDASAEGKAVDESLGLSFIKAKAEQAATQSEGTGGVGAQIESLTAGVAMQQMASSQASVLNNAMAETARNVTGM